MFRFFSEFWFGIENMFPHKQTRHKKIIVRSPFEIENTENQQQAVGIYISRVMVLGTVGTKKCPHAASRKDLFRMSPEIRLASTQNQLILRIFENMPVNLTCN